jgi:hypothetical protein
LKNAFVALYGAEGKMKKVNCLIAVAKSEAEKNAILEAHKALSVQLENDMQSKLAAAECMPTDLSGHHSDQSNTQPMPVFCVGRPQLKRAEWQFSVPLENPC